MFYVGLYEMAQWRTSPVTEGNGGNVDKNRRNILPLLAFQYHPNRRRDLARPKQRRKFPEKLAVMYVSINNLLVCDV
jgi:hypothetical protein